MVVKLALAIAEGQLALDLNSIKVAQMLADITLPKESVIVAIKETVDAEGNVTSVEPVFNKADLPLIAYGLNPTFYQFTDTIIEVKITITIRLERSLDIGVSKKFDFKSTTDTSFNYKTGGLASLFTGTAKFGVKNTTTIAYASTFDAKYSQKYTFSAEGTSLLRTVMKPVPPPNRAIPTIIAKEEIPE
ncbi:MAG TPA: hypothetical protein ENN18_00035 [Proteobacteria bacterium]|nr:hypothetical protein [Pseudomonadota bacterium]